MATVYCVIQPVYLYQIYCSQQLNKQLTSEKNIFERTIISFHRFCMLAIIQTDSETITAMAKDCNRILLFLQLFSLDKEFLYSRDTKGNLLTRLKRLADPSHGTAIKSFRKKEEAKSKLPHAL